MVSYPIENYINDNDWQRQLRSYWKKESFQELLHKVQERRQHAVVYPPEQRWFEAFNQCPWQQAKVLILGQDPYHGPNQAHGLAFSVPQGEKLPPSLRNIYKELKSDLDIEPAFSGDLSPWAKEGVLLLNSSLTVEEGQAGAHAQWGWEGFSDWVIRSLAEEKKRMVFILWGAWAQQKAALIDPQEHRIISSAHPSPLSAHRGFFGSRPFSQCNDYLEQVGKKPIRWALPW